MYDFRVKIYFVGSVENVLIIHKNDGNILVSGYWAGAAVAAVAPLSNLKGMIEVQEWHIRNYCVRDATPQYDLKDYIVFSDFVQIGVLFPDTLEQQGLLLADLESGDFMLHKWVNIYSSMDELEREDD